VLQENTMPYRSHVTFILGCIWPWHLLFSVRSTFSCYSSWKENNFDV